MARILVLGSRGRLGAALARAWGAESADRSVVDVSDLGRLRDFLRSKSFEVLVNCTGLTSLEACEDDPALARLVNAEAPGVMAHEAGRAGARLIHFSTDYVFDGELDRAYREEDEPRPLSVYGLSKLEGERAVLG
ncbi:MAG: sugar nucleotide-binding protein, partial [Terrimicrobiaceae bacterium]|nr:sugar nucleotide-binding protein [Terrimicrobiaceae bacterium]